MSPLDWILLALVAALIGAALYVAFRRKKTDSCCGSCGGCTCDCAKKGTDNHKNL